MKITHFVAVSLVCMLCGGVCAYAQKMTEDEYRSRWQSTEDSFAQQHAEEVTIEEKKKDVGIYLQMGKDYLDKKDYATALMCFRTVIELEGELGLKNNTEFAQSQIARVESQMKQEIRQDLNNAFGKSWPRREEGLKRILDRMPSTYTQRWAEEQEQRRLAAIEAEKKKARDAMRRRKLELEQQVLQRSLEVNEELYVKRLELLKKQVEVDELIRYAKELFAEHSYAEAVDAANKALGVDPNSSVAKAVKDDALYRLEEERIAVAKKEAETQRAIAEMKKKQAEEARMRKAEEVAQHLSQGKELFARNEFIEAIAQFREVLKLDRENLEARLFIEQIKLKLENARNVLDNPAESAGQQAPVSEQVVTPSLPEVAPEASRAPVESLRRIPKTNLSIPVLIDVEALPPAKDKVSSGVVDAPSLDNAALPEVTTSLGAPQPLASPGVVTIPAQENEAVSKPKEPSPFPTATQPAEQTSSAVEKTESVAKQSQQANIQVQPEQPASLTPGQMLNSSDEK